jgi:hypothetical protein
MTDRDDLVQQLFEIETEIDAVIKRSKTERDHFDKWSGGQDESNREKFADRVNHRLKQLESKRNVLKRLIGNMED